MKRLDPWRKENHEISQTRKNFDELFDRFLKEPNKIKEDKMSEDFCFECGHLLSKNHTLCPYCGNSQKYEPLNEGIFRNYGIEHLSSDLENENFFDQLDDSQ